MLPFFIRRYNDVDHITPIVYRMAKDGIQNLQVLCLEPGFDLAGDPRIRFLREEMRIPVVYAYQAMLPTWKHRSAAWLARVLRPSSSNQPGFAAKLKSCQFRSLCDSRVWERLFGFDWAAHFLKTVRPGVLVFDWQKPRLPIVKALFAAAKQQGIPIVGVPHGGHLTIDRCFTNEAVEMGTPPDFGDSWAELDRIVIQDPWFAELVTELGVDRHKVRVIGSARYCREWADVLCRLYENVSPPSSRGGRRLKVLYLDHDAKYRIYPDRVVSGLERLAKLDFVDLLIKPSTGGALRLGGRGSAGLSSRALASVATITTDIPTVTLVKWADVVMGTTTSALIEAPVQGKPVIMPRHFHGNSTLFDTLGACWPVRNDDELVEAISSLRHDQRKLPYGHEDVGRFLTQVVYGGEPGRDVLGMYKDFILAVRDGRA